MQINLLEKHSATHIKTQVTHARARILQRLCKVNFAALQNTRVTRVMRQIIQSNAYYNTNALILLHNKFNIMGVMREPMILLAETLFLQTKKQCNANCINSA